MPLPAVDDVLGVVAAYAPNCLITDVVSVKRPVADAVEKVLPGARYVGGHPMAGTAESGWSAGSADLLRGAAWVVGIEDETPVEDWIEVADLALTCGAEVVPTGLDEHDAAVARVSHLPHLLAAVLASVGADGGSLALALAAGSFADGTRVAGSRARAGSGDVRGQPRRVAGRGRRRAGPAGRGPRFAGLHRVRSRSPSTPATRPANV